MKKYILLLIGLTLMSCSKDDGELFLETYDRTTWQLFTVLQPSGADCDNNDCNRVETFRGGTIWVITNNIANGKFLANCDVVNGSIGGSISKHTKDEVVFTGGPTRNNTTFEKTTLKVENGKLKMILPYVDESVPEGELIFTYNEIVYDIEDCQNSDLNLY